MSQFLPDQFQTGTQPIGGPTPQDVTAAQAVFGAAAQYPQQIVDQLMPYITDALNVSGLQIPISQITGFSQGSGQYSFVGTVETTTSLTYTDLTTVGPQLTVTDGQYAIFHGSLMQCVSGGGSVATQSVSVNGVTPIDADGTATNAATMLIPGMIALFKTIATGANNTIKVQYKGNDAAKTFQFRNRWLFAIRLKAV
jgi:hypothetical protein